MTKRPVLDARWHLAGLACGGVLLAHSLGYLVAAPDPHDRLLLLNQTGHQLWPLVVALAVGGVMWGFAGFGLRVLRSRRTTTSHVSLFASLTGLLLAFQSVIFLTLEGGERLYAGADVAALLSEPAVLAGLAVQLVVALFSAAVLLGVVRVVEQAVATRRFVRLRSTGPSPLCTSLLLLPPSPATGASTPRGPPRP